MKLLISSVGAVTLFLSSAAFACRPAPPADYDPSAGSSEPPPLVELSDTTVSLGRSFGRPGPGDCSDLGSVEFTLKSPDGSMLDGRFGAKLVVTEGKLPAVAVDLASWVGAIRDNKVTLPIADPRSSAVEFSVAVQLVNSMGEVGALSSVSEGKAGCSVAGGIPLGLLALVFARRARRRPV